MSFTYSVNYPFYLSGFAPVAFSSEWSLMYEILIALFGSPIVLPSNISFQYYDSANTNWLTLSSLPAPLVQPGGWAGIARLVWTPPEFSITIPEGSYSPTNLAETIQTLMNKEYIVGTKLEDADIDQTGNCFNFGARSLEDIKISKNFFI